MNTNHLAPEWPKADIAALKVLWFAGAKKTEIAEALGKTLGQVSGFIHRHRDELGFRQKRAAQINQGKLWAKRWLENRP